MMPDLVERETLDEEDIPWDCDGCYPLDGWDLAGEDEEDGD
jgi:hypothetical protein